MTEDQKYQGALYKEKNNKKQKIGTPSKHQDDEPNAMAPNLQAYVEDSFDSQETWRDFLGQTEDERSPAEPPPEAPTPPAATTEDDVNVFDFLVATGQTPNTSTLGLPREDPVKEDESKSLVPYEYDSDSYIDPPEAIRPPIGFQTPAAAKNERRKTKDGSVKTDKKRKRLHVDIPGDQEMTDAPPMLHSGLTGGLNRLMQRPTLPPSPNYSGGEGNANPASPTKKSKHSKHHKSGQVSNSLFGMLAGSSKVKSKKRKTEKKKSSRREKQPKLIEYRPRSRDGKDNNGDSQMVVYRPRADVLFNFVKGPESDRGVSMNKALKRFHRERVAAGSELSKTKEEKELWRSIRLRKNDRGEVVLFSISDEE